MTQELHYTSAPRGLKPGSVGFCTVAQTPNLPGSLADRLEGLSGYHQLFPPHDPQAMLNPVALSHLRIESGGREYSVLSRVGFAGLDYSARSNKYAHHVVLDPQERPEGGPAWLLGQPGFMQLAWEGGPRTLPTGRPTPRGDRPPGVARGWKAQVGDAGWAGVLAESFLADPRKPAYLLFEPGTQLLPLFAEALALIPADRRWDVEFSTYFTQLPQGTACPWRGVLAGSAEAKNVHRVPGALVIDLRRPAGEARGGDLVHLARTGKLPERSAERSPIPPDASKPSAEETHEPPRLPGRGRGAARPPAVEDPGFSGPLPPRAPIARSVRELEGLGDEATALPWGKIAAGLTATLLIALGAGFWLLGGLQSSVKAPDLIAKVSQDTSKKVEIAGAEKKQAEDKAKLDAVEKQKEADQKLAAAQEKAPEKTEPKAPQTDGSSEVMKKPPDPGVESKAYTTVRAFKLPQIADQDRDLNRATGTEVKSEKTAELDFPAEISRIRIVFNNNRKASQTGPSVAQLASTEIKDGLTITRPSQSAIGDTLKLGSFTKSGTRLVYSWDEKPNQWDLIEHFKDSVLVVETADGGKHYVLLRNLGDRLPIRSTTRLPINGLKGKLPSDFKPRVSDPIRWVDRESLAQSGWDLRVTAWRIDSQLGSPAEGESIAITPAAVIPEEFEIGVTSDPARNHDLSVKLHFEPAVIAAKNDERKARIERIKIERDLLKKSEQPRPQDDLALKKESEKIKSVFNLYNHIQNARTRQLSFVLSLHIGDELIELARFGTFAAPTP